MNKQIQIGVGNAKNIATGFINAWKRVERGEKVEVEQRLDFENLETLLKTLTSGRWVLWNTQGPGPISKRRFSDMRVRMDSADTAHPNIVFAY
ncbi:MAG: hypothetical protein ABIN18_18625 [Pseudomonadota bacterium]